IFAASYNVVSILVITLDINAIKYGKPSHKFTIIMVILASLVSDSQGIFCCINPYFLKIWFIGPNCPLNKLLNTNSDIIPGMAHGNIYIVRQNFLNLTLLLFMRAAIISPIK